MIVNDFLGIINFGQYLDKLTIVQQAEDLHSTYLLATYAKGGFKSEGRGGFSRLPKMSAEKTGI